MAQVPISQNRVALQPLPGANVRTADFGSAGEQVGKAAARVGSQIADFAEYQEKVQSTHDDAAAKEAENAVRRHYSEVGFTGADPYFQKVGKPALEQRGKVETDIDGFIEQTLGNLKNERQKEMFRRAVEPQRTAWATQIAVHADKETKVYELGESESRRALTGELAREMFVQDPGEAQKQVQTGLTEIDNIARSRGWGPEQTTAEKLKYSSGIYKDIGRQLVHAGGNDGPALGQAIVDKFGGSMTADDRDSVLSVARAQQNHLEVERRRAATEQRRVEREAQQDARERALSVAENIDLAIPMNADDYSSAVTDAKASGDEALLKRIETGQFKNNLAQEYRSVPPPQIQERVNQLDAEIAKRGEKVKPETVIERDHLQTLLNKSNSELNSDALSWGARHLGIDPGTLDLKDAGSIQRRIAAAARVSRATGKPPQPLTTEEVQALAPTLSTGSIEQKQKTIIGLARMGPLALSAAEQLTGDKGYHNLIGLATHVVPSVGASRVNQILTGQEVLKAKPKLIDKDRAQKEMDAFSGDAFRFFAGARNGVFSNAQALLASEANEQGWTEWAQAKDRWFAAVNSALGAYTRDGKQRGGLAKINGGTTILPEDMAQDEFEERIAKSHGPEFRKAGNGVPVFASGESPSAADLKRMQWVPSGDGVYRLSNGNEFLMKRGGGFYEVNVRKLTPSSISAENLARYGYTRR